MDDQDKERKDKATQGEAGDGNVDPGGDYGPSQEHGGIGAEDQGEHREVEEIVLPGALLHVVEVIASTHDFA
jgi:hypothetical protein